MSRASPLLSHTTRKLINTNRLYYHSSSRGNRMKSKFIHAPAQRFKILRFGFALIVGNYQQQCGTVARRWRLLAAFPRGTLPTSYCYVIVHQSAFQLETWSCPETWCCREKHRFVYRTKKATPTSARARELFLQQTLPFVTVTLSASSILELTPGNEDTLISISADVPRNA